MLVNFISRAAVATNSVALSLYVRVDLIQLDFWARQHLDVYVGSLHIWHVLWGGPAKRGLMRYFFEPRCDFLLTGSG